MKNALMDKNFLYELDHQHLREVFAKVISLDFNENPIEEIIGRVSQGSISVDNKSAVRRTCSLTLVANRNNGEDFNLHEYYWGLSQKIQVFIGLKNRINAEYPEIIWFPQGVFLITQFNTSQNINSYSISIQGKDKMALLNGEIGGNITSLSFDFGTEDIINKDGTITNKSLLLKDIISEVVHEYAKEPYHNIIINDLDDVGLELMEYRGSKPMYLIVDQNSSDVEQMVLDDNFTLYKRDGEKIKIKNLQENEFDHRIQLNLEGANEPLFLYSEDSALAKNSPKTVIKCSYGDVVGYKITDLTFAGDLIGQVGNPVTSACLDKIVKMLGDFEYFYNLDGKFVFQRKKTYINTSFNTMRNADSDFIPVLITSEAQFKEGTYYIYNHKPGQLSDQEEVKLEMFADNVYSLYSSQFAIASEYKPGVTYYKRIYLDSFVNDAADMSSVAYSFENSNLITAFQNNPKLSDIKNDFSIWGERQSKNSSVKLPVHMRYAIDQKPVYYRNYEGHLFLTKDYNDNPELRKTYMKSFPFYDWREIIYQMAIDYSLYNHDDDFLATIRLNNIDYYPTGYTGYEQYYIDMHSFWRQLYYPDCPGSYEVTTCDNTDYKKNKGKYYWYQQCKKGDKFKPTKKTYYILNVRHGYSIRKNLTEEFFNLHPDYYYTLECNDESNALTMWNKNTTYYVKVADRYDPNTFWNKDIQNSPETLNFWFDFLDTDGQLSQYSAHLIGDRPKAINDTKIKSIYFREVPTIVFVEDTLDPKEYYEQKTLKTGYTFLKIPSDMKNLFSISGQGQSAKDKLESLLYNDACCAETVSITSIPVYYLEPNTRIFVRDDESGINGEYIVSRISFNLGKGETMNISAEKAIERIY